MTFMLEWPFLGQKYDLIFGLKKKYGGHFVQLMEFPALTLGSRGRFFYPPHLHLLMLMLLLVRCNESITYTTHGDFTFLDNLEPLLERLGLSLDHNLYIYL
jgi:hypothetical protein